MTVHVGKCIDNISKKLNCFFEAETGDFVEIVEKSTSVHIFHGQVDIWSFLKVAIKTYNVRVLQTGVQLYLSAKLIYHLKLNHFGLIYFLEGYQHA